MLQFQSTPSARRATLRALFMTCSTANFNPRPPRGGRPRMQSAAFSGREISIHALREEGDVRNFICPKATDAISIHALREEGDPLRAPVLRLRGNFNPRPPRGGRPLTAQRDVLGTFISIHALREEGDDGHKKRISIIDDFNPRPPRGGRQCTAVRRRERQHFNPRPPRGGRPGAGRSPTAEQWISIHALREEGDLDIHFFLLVGISISIHALREEGDSKSVYA